MIFFFFWKHVASAPKSILRVETDALTDTFLEYYLSWCEFYDCGTPSLTSLTLLHIGCHSGFIISSLKNVLIVFSKAILGSILTPITFLQVVLFINNPEIRFLHIHLHWCYDQFFLICIWFTENYSINSWKFLVLVVL